MIYSVVFGGIKNNIITLRVSKDTLFFGLSQFLRIMNKLLLACLLALPLLLSGQMSHAQKPRVPWARLSSVTLTDYQGHSTTIKPAKLNVFVLLSPECPLSRNYITVINKLAKQTEVRFYGVVPGAAYSTADLSKFIKDYKPIFPVLIDSSKRLTTGLNGTITPECVLIDQHGQILYRGLIDNWAYSLGQQRKVITEKYLEEALMQARSGQTIQVNRTKPVGCLINDL